MNKQTKIRITSFCAAFVFLMIGAVIKEKSVSDKYELEIKNNYSKAYSELDSRINNIGIILDKIVYLSGSKKLSALSAELYSEAQLAKNALSALPVLNSENSTLNRFLSQVGNYALSVSGSVTKDEEITDKQENDFLKLLSTAKTISGVLSDNQENINSSLYWAEEIEEKISSDDESLASVLTELEENLTDYPTLIYDGPYSDHILNKKPVMTSAKPEISKEEALNIAKEFSGEKNLKFSNEINSKIPSYRFTGKTEITVSKSGGYVIYMRKSEDFKKAVISKEEALRKAEEFLKVRGIENMISTYYYCDEGVCTVNFAYLDGRTVCYTDLIKVGVSLESGETVFYEASGYLTNHMQRAFLSAEHSLEEAEQKINKKLTVEKSGIALIPTSGGSEVRCYEFLCKTQKDEEMLVFIGISSLETENIFILLKSDGGTLIK